MVTNDNILWNVACFRDGSAVEIVGLCKSTVRWLAELSGQKLFPYAGVSKLQDGMSLLWALFTRRPCCPKRLKKLCFTCTTRLSQSRSLGFAHCRATRSKARLVSKSNVPPSKWKTWERGKAGKTKLFQSLGTKWPPCDKGPWTRPQYPHTNSPDWPPYISLKN